MVPGIHIQVGIELLQGDFQPAAFEQTPDGRRRDAFSEGRNNTAGHEDMLSHSSLPDLRERSGRRGTVPARAPRSSGVSTPERFVVGFDHADFESIFKRAKLLQPFRTFEWTYRQTRIAQQKFPPVNVEADVFIVGGFPAIAARAPVKRE